MTRQTSNINTPVNEQPAEQAPRASRPLKIKQLGEVRAGEYRYIPAGGFR